jgi:hypothetical protein
VGGGDEEKCLGRDHEGWTKKGIAETYYVACELLGCACPLETNSVVQ